jgi:hypothetical protein
MGNKNQKIFLVEMSGRLFLHSQKQKGPLVNRLRRLPFTEE